MVTKVQQKSDKITPFGGINFVLDKYDAYLGGEIDSCLGLRSTTIGYQSARSYVPSSVFSSAAEMPWKT